MKNSFCLLLFIAGACLAQAQQKLRVPEIGVVQHLVNDSLLAAQGFRYVVESVGKMVSPKTVSEAQFLQNANKIKTSRIPVYALNIFIPGELKVVGPDVDENEVLKYVETVFQRCKIIGVTKIIWGSGGSRRVPEGFDHAKAKQQFISIAAKIAAAASRYNITLALENLNSTETNFITTVKEATDIIKKVDHPNLRLCVDVYHMLKEGESPDAIALAKGVVVYCEVAEKDGRTPPGIQGEDFKPYFAMLKKIGYDDKIMIECRWDDIVTQGLPAFQYLEKQVHDVYGRK